VEDPLCLICMLEEELVEHILWDCDSARDKWAACSRKIQKCPSMETTSQEFHYFGWEAG
jgi:hypothetical protein